MQGKCIYNAGIASKLNGDFTMRYVVWLVRLLVFVLVLMFALNNTGEVDVRFFGDFYARGVPLIVVMLVVFVLGAVFGLLLTLSSVMRRNREIKRLKRELTRLEDDIRYPASKTGPEAPETVAPLAPL